VVDDEFDPAAGDLSPRPVIARRRRRWVPLAIVGVVGVAVLALLFSVLGSAALFFKNADEAVSERQSLGSKRFRMQGTVVPGTVSDVTTTDGVAGVAFTIAYHDVRVDVVHVGAMRELFQPGVPVVLEGRWEPRPAPALDGVACRASDGWHFASDNMVVKHDNEYTAKGSERVDEAVAGGTPDCAAKPVNP